jgi:hypothetical protein
MSKKLVPVYLISEELFKLYSNVSRNVGVDRVIPYLNLSQPFYIVPVLGKPLFDELISQIQEQSLTAANKALILEIAPALALWTDYLAVRGMAYSFTEKGLTKEKSENSESLNDRELANYRLDIQNQAEMATELLIKYLCQCHGNYPLWRPHNPCLCKKYIPKKGSAEIKFNTQIYLPELNKRCQCRNKRHHISEVQNDDAFEDASTDYLFNLL